jgi:hypothetical protein
LSIVSRLILCLLALTLLSCGSSKPPAPLFPGTVGPWKLKQAADLAAERAPDAIRKLGIRRAGSATYEGPGTLDVRIYELTSPAAAFEAEQQWRPVADTVAVHKDSLFTVVHWQGADRAAVSVFIREMEKGTGR